MATQKVFVEGEPTDEQIDELLDTLLGKVDDAEEPEEVEDEEDE